MKTKNIVSIVTWQDEHGTAIQQIGKLKKRQAKSLVNFLKREYNLK